MMQFTNRLFFKVDTHVIHDSNNVHSLVPSKVGPSRCAIIVGNERSFEKKELAVKALQLYCFRCHCSGVGAFCGRRISDDQTDDNGAEEFEGVGAHQCDEAKRAAQYRTN